MSWKFQITGLMGLALIVQGAWAQGMSMPTTPQTPQAPQAAAPSPTPEQLAQPPQTGAFAQAAPAGTGGEGGFNPSMIGDLLGPTMTAVVHDAHGATHTAKIPLAARAAFKIADDESPRPVDRVFINYNYFSNALGAANDSADFPRIDVHRETIGFEKTFLDGNASVGLRLPFFEQHGDGSISEDNIGDLTVVLKYALINDRESGDVLSGGLAVTAPTGPAEAFDFDGSSIHDTLLQPWAGFIFNMGDLYVHGFTSVVVPTDSRDVTILFDDIGVGYWLYRDRDAFVTAIIPTVEAHVTTPLNHRDSDTAPISIPDWVDITAGAHFEFNERSVLTVGASVPLTGPKPYDFEAIVQFNLRF